MKYSALLVSLVCPWFLYFSLVIEHRPKNRLVEITIQEDLKERAFSALRDKCNVCHAAKKKTDIFTLINMDSFAPDIHKQVFVKRKMPKGRKIKLTDDERNQLQVWLDETLIEK